MINHGIVFQTVNNIIVIATNKTPYIGSTHDLGFVWPVGDPNWREMSGLKFNSVSEKLCDMAGKPVMLQFWEPLLLSIWLDGVKVKLRRAVKNKANWSV